MSRLACRRCALRALLFLLVPAALGATPAAAQEVAQEVPQEVAAEVDIVHAAATVIQARLAGEVDADQLDVAAIRGMTRWLDQSTGIAGNDLLTQSQDAARRARLLGQRQGLGIEFSLVAGRGLLVNAVFEQSPADLVGVVPGDLVIAIDDQSFTGLSKALIQAAVLPLSRDDHRSTVTLDLRRADQSLRRLSLEPGIYRRPVARVTMGDDRVVVRVDVIGQAAVQIVAGALEHADGRPIIVDLRDASQGTLPGFLGLCGLFLSSGQPALRTVDPSGRVDTHRTVTDGLVTGALAVLINGGTSGLAEGLAAALHNGLGAPLVGSRTAGVDRLPSFHPLGDGMVLQLADTAMMTGLGVSWASTGLSADLVVEPVQIALVGGTAVAPPDIQLEAALRFLQPG